MIQILEIALCWFSILFTLIVILSIISNKMRDK